MIDYFKRLIANKKLPPIADDDESVEARYPKVRFAENSPVIRKMQRKCFMRAEHMRAHPELYRHIDRATARFEHLAQGPAPRVGSPSTTYDHDEPFDFTGIEQTAPPSVRRGGA